MQRKRLLLLVAVGLVAVGLLTGLYWSQAATALRGVEPSCTIGVTGSAATITIQAWSAPGDCRDITDGRASFLGGPAAPGSFYAVTGTTPAPVLCELDKRGRHIIIRDQGFLTLVGSGECELLAKL